MTIKSLRIIPEGVAFSVEIENKKHSCLIAEGALKRLYAFGGTTLDCLDVYRAYETRIHGVARKLILNGAAEHEFEFEFECESESGSEIDQRPLLVLRAPDFSSTAA
jgi:hypothetical protein